jgi:Glucose-regulated metallo-peptidase M90
LQNAKTVTLWLHWLYVNAKALTSILIMQLSKLIYLPLFLILAFGAIITFMYGSQYATIMIPPGILMGLTFVLSPQIDWWWYQKHPPQIMPALRNFLEKHSAFFQTLSTESAQQRFRERAMLTKIAIDFKTPTDDDDPVTEDLKLVIAATAATLTFQWDEYLLKKFENVVVFNGAFISPQYPHHQHASEVFEPDGVLLFSAPHLMKGFMHPQQYYDICMHEWARALVLSYPDLPWPADDPQRWLDLERISGFPAPAIAQWINRPDLELLPATIVNFFHFNQRFQQQLPDLHALLTAIFQKG